MSIIIPEDEIYGESKRVGFVVMLLQLLGVLLLIVILYFTIKNQKELNQASESKTRIEGELQAASDIQSSMLPKTFPPFPSRDDIDMAAAIVPACLLVHVSTPELILAIFGAVLAIYQHRPNIKRLLQGTEADFKAAPEKR